MEVLERLFDVFPRGDVVFDLVDEGRKWDAARVGGAI